MAQQDLNGEALLAGLTAKQREVLDLLLEHKTSKEIARRLRISPHTVDQRLHFAREKLGAHSRSEVAVAYRQLRDLYGKTAYGELGIAAGRSEADGGFGAEAAVEKLPPRARVRFAAAQAAEADHLVVQEVFDGRHGTLMRLGAIIAIAVLLMLLVLGALATLSQLSLLFER